MAKKTSTVKLGIFIFLGITILVVAIFMLGGKEQLFSSTFNVKAYFKTVQGLKTGADAVFILEEKGGTFYSNALKRKAHK